MELAFPHSSWLSFQRRGPIASLLESLPSLRDFTVWPTQADWQSLADDQGVWERLGVTLSFVHDEKLGQRARRRRQKIPGRTYEAAIVERNEIPTRAQDPHDFFNAIVWINFPLSKFALHSRAFIIQRAWAEEHDASRRCPLADRLTCFDEGGIVLELNEGMKREDIEPLIQSRDDEAKQKWLAQHAHRFSLFGHGMMEVMMAGKTDIYASCIILDPGPGSLDFKLSRYLTAFDEKTPDHGAINVSWLT